MGNKRVADTLNRLNENILIIGFIATIVVLLIQIIARTFFDNAFGWVEEVARYLFIFCIFGGTALAFRKGLFISVDVLGGFFSSKGKLILDISSNVLTIIFFLCVSYLGMKLFNLSKGQLTPALQLEIRFVYLTFPVFFLQLTYFAVVKMISNIKRLKDILREGKEK